MAGRNDQVAAASGGGQQAGDDFVRPSNDGGVLQRLLRIFTAVSFQGRRLLAILEVRFCKMECGTEMKQREDGMI
jgi:hypothetical protein